MATTVQVICPGEQKGATFADVDEDGGVCRDRWSGAVFVRIPERDGWNAMWLDPSPLTPCKIEPTRPVDIFDAEIVVTLKRRV